MISLGIESTAHTFGVGIIDDEGNVLADARDTYKPEAGKGFVPKELEDHHMNVAKIVLEKAVSEAGISLKDIDIVSFSQGMGIPNALKVGAAVARYISIKYNKPLVGVNHGIAHIEIGRLTTGCEDPVVLYASGGNTQIITYRSGRYRVMGETEDISVGNLLDNIARKLGFEMPGGPKIEQLAKKGKNFIKLPYVVKGMDVSFSGILTEALRLLQKGVKPEDLAYSLQEVCFSMLTEAVERALAHTEKNEVLIVGGVAANQRLREMMNIMCEERGGRLFLTPLKYSGDNGVMIAWTGILFYKTGYVTELEKSTIKQKWRIDEVEIPYLY